MKLSSLAMFIASYSSNYDPYSFDDCFETLEDGATQIENMLTNEPETVYAAIAEMVLFASDTKESEEGAKLLYSVSRLAKFAV